MGVEKEQNTFSPAHARSTVQAQALSFRRTEMSLLHKLIASLQHRTENPPKYDENLRAEDGFVRPSKGFLRIY